MSQEFGQLALFTSLLKTKPTTTTIITAAVVEYATPTAVATAKRHSENSDDDIFTKYDDTS